jgi:hypothetical protein
MRMRSSDHCLTLDNWPFPSSGSLQKMPWSGFHERFLCSPSTSNDTYHRPAIIVQMDSLA